MGGGSKGASEDRYSGAMENLIQLSELMQQASALLAAEGEDAGGAQEATAPLKSRTSFLTVVALGNMVRPQLSPRTTSCYRCCCLHCHCRLEMPKSLMC